MNGDRLEYDPHVGHPLTDFDTRMRAFIRDAETVPILLVSHGARVRGTGGFEPLDVDSFSEGFVDLDDLLSGDDASFRLNVIHVLAERLHIRPGNPREQRWRHYDRLRGTSELRQDGVFTPAHNAGLRAERDHLRALLNDPTLASPTEPPTGTLVFRFSSAHRYDVVHRLPTRRGGEFMTGSVRIVTRPAHGRPQTFTVEDWLAGGGWQRLAPGAAAPAHNASAGAPAGAP